jgi:polyisoprenoid-binding protein YceI
LGAAAVVLTLGLAPAERARAEPADYALDPTHSFVHFEWPHLGTSILRGRFNRSGGRVTLDRAAGSGRAEITIQTASISTGAASLDAALRGPQGLDAERHPQALFVGERFVFEGERVREVAGTLTLRGRSAPLSLVARRFDCYLSPLFKREVCGGDFEAALRPLQWGLDAALGLPDEIRLLVQVEGIRQ